MGMTDEKAFDEAMGEVVHLSDRKMERKPSGELRSDKKSRRNMPVNWKQEAERRGNRLIAVVKERQMAQQMILEECVKLTALGFTCEHGDLADCEHFLQIKAFAASVAHITRPPIEDLRLDGMRSVGKIEDDHDAKQVAVYLECGHVRHIDFEEHKAMKLQPTVGELWVCPTCRTMLREKGILEK